MSKGKHTPLPWGIESDSGLTPGGSLAVVHRDAKGRGIIVAEVFPGNDKWAGSNKNEPIAKANARVIAAAPELLAALEAAVELLEAFSPDDSLDPEAYNIARWNVLIAKATGKEPSWRDAKMAKATGQ